MVYFLTALFISFITTMWLVRYHHLHSHLSHDHDTSGPQKFHDAPVPRIGGVGIAAGLLGAVLLAWLRGDAGRVDMLMLLIAASVVFGAGLAEDITKRVSPLVRLLFAAAATLIACEFIAHATIDRLDIIGLDWLIAIPLIGALFTAFAVAGIANAVNIIDGFNGLSSIVVCTMLFSLMYVALAVGDSFVLSLSLALFGAIIGFSAWNYPAGHIFLGDGGAYLIGFLVADLSVVLVGRHASVSPWYPVLLFMYPLIETLFSMYRRRLKKKPASVPDGVHLHSLLYRRMIRWTLGFQHISAKKRNAMTSPYLWLLSSMAVIPATLFFQSTWVLMLFCVLFIVSYIWIYRRLIRFNAPFWLGLLHQHRHREAVKPDEPNEPIETEDK